MEKLNNKIKNGRTELITDAQMVANYAYDATADRMRRLETNSNGALSVDIHGGSVGSGDLKARTDIADASTSTFLKCNTDGTLEMTAELDSSGLAKESVQTDGTQKAQVLGNTVGDGSGDNKNILVDSDGHLQVDVLSGGGGGTQYAVGTTGMATGTGTLMIGNYAGSAKEVAVNVNGQVVHELGFINSAVKGQDTSANSVPVVIASDNTVAVSNTNITAGSDDTLTSAQQVLAYGRKDASPSGLRAIEVDNEGQVFTTNQSITSGSDATLTTSQQVLCYGRDISGNLDALRTDASGHLEVTIDDFVKGQATMANSFSVVVASDQSAIDVNQAEATNIGASNNLANNITLTSSGGTSSVVDVSNMNICNILYEDTNTGNFDGVEVEVSFESTGSTFYKTTSFFPSDNTAVTKRTSALNINVHGLSRVRLVNNSSTTFNNVYAVACGSP